MVLSFFKRYGVVLCAAIYTVLLIVLHTLGRFPAPGPYDLSKLTGSPALIVQGRVLDFPQTRWRQTRFLMEGRAWPLEAFQGRVLVNLKFPVEDLAPGEEIRVRGWLATPKGLGPKRTFDERAYWAGYKAFAVLQVWSPASFERLTPEVPATFVQQAWLFHQRFKQFWFDHLPPEEAALLSGITMGSRGVLPKEIKNQCIRAGIYHIVVVSGQNVALIVALGMGLLQLLRVPRRRAFWICCLPILFYVYAVGADPPVLRAATMAIVTLVTLAMGRDVPSYFPFVLAWFWILLWEPEVLFGASFQLSFGATASLLAFLPAFRVLRAVRSRFWRWLAEAGTLSLSVHLGIWPILVYYFHQISLVGFIANGTLFPLFGGIMVAGLILGTWGVGSPESVPAPLLDGMHVVMKQTLAVIERMSGWSWAAISVSPPSGWVCGVYYGLLICILVKRNHAQK